MKRTTEQTSCKKFVTQCKVDERIQETTTKRAKHYEPIATQGREGGPRRTYVVSVAKGLFSDFGRSGWGIFIGGRELYLVNLAIRAA
jgi:hypothetical protein